jgi:hypothetical protein
MAMLSAGAPGFDSVRSTSGNSITATDVSACLARLDRMTYLYSLEKFALDRGSRLELNNLAVDEALKMRFKLLDNESNMMVAILALSALEIAINPHKCRKCKGVGEIKLGAKIEVCESCKGLGSRAISERNLAKMLGVTLFQARKVWKKRFDLLLSKYMERDAYISAAIFHGLKDQSV